MFYRRDASNTALGRELQPRVVRLRQAVATRRDQQDSGASCDHEQHDGASREEGGDHRNVADVFDGREAGNFDRLGPFDVWRVAL